MYWGESADLEMIRAVVEDLSIPVVANGNVRCLYDAHENLSKTGAAGVMSACGLLVDPALFDDSGGPYSQEKARNVKHRISMAGEYLSVCEREAASVREMRDHILCLVKRLPEANKHSATGFGQLLMQVTEIEQFRDVLHAILVYRGESDSDRPAKTAREIIGKPSRRSESENDETPCPALQLVADDY